jgi:uncharacterized protein YhaN
MKIHRIYIDGYGRAEATEIVLAPGLTILRGENGTGKTTVHQFLRAVLFGFVKDQYPLVRGGKRGGTIGGVTDSGETYELTRYGDAVTGAGQSLTVHIGGKKFDDPYRALASVTGGVTRNVFESVFAFGQDELRDVSRLTKSEVSNRIYGASIGVVADVLKVEAAISAEADALWKARGSIPAINQRLSRIEGLRLQSRSRDLPAEYGALRRELDELGNDRKHVGEELREAEGAIRDVMTLMSAHGPWSQARDAERQLAGLPQEPLVVALDLAREAELAKAANLAIERAAAARAVREKLDGLLLEANYREDVIERSGEIDEAAATASQWQAREAGLAETVRRAGAVRRAIDAVLGESGWDPARLAAADMPALRRVIAEHAAANLEGPARGTSAPTERVRAETTAVERLRGQVTALDRELETLEPVTPARPDSLEAGATVIVRDEEQARALLAQREVPAQPSESPFRRARLPIAAGGLLLIGGLIVAIAVVVPVGVLIAASGLVTLAVALARARPPAPTVTFEHPSLAAGRELETAIDSHWATLDVGVDIRNGGTAALLEEARRLRSLADARSRVQRDRDRTFEELNRQEVALRAAVVAEQEAIGAVAIGVDDWRAFITDMRFPKAIDRDGAVALLTKLETARSQLDELAALEIAIAKSAKDRKLWTDGVSRLASDLGIQLDEDASVMVERLRQDLATARASARAREDLSRQRDGAGSIERAADALVAETGREHAAFMEAHGVADAISLQGRHERTRRRQALDAALKQALETLAGLIDAERRDLVESALDSFDRAAAEGQVGALEAQAAAIRVRRDANIATIAERGEQLRRLEQDADTSVARQALADELGALSADATRWLELRVATELLRATRGQYEAKHRPAVLARAESLFVDWTEGEYVGFDRLSGTGLEAVVGARDGKRVPLAGLSRGTSEQLYLAMRIALVEHLATQQESLPLVMDDVLVNFDARRGERVARAIEGLAEHRQVVYLTCHQDVHLKAQRTVDLGADVSVISVQDAVVVAS